MFADDGSECRHFLEDDGTQYLEEKGIVTKRWPAVPEREAEEEVTEDQLMQFVEEVEALKAMADADLAMEKARNRAELLERIKRMWEDSK